MSNIGQNFKNIESFLQITVQLAADGTKSKNWVGYGGVWLVGFLNGGMAKPKCIKVKPNQYANKKDPTLLL